MEAVDPVTPQPNEPRTKPLPGSSAATTTETTGTVTTDGSTAPAAEAHATLSPPGG